MSSNEEEEEPASSISLDIHLIPTPSQTTEHHTVVNDDVTTPQEELNSTPERKERLHTIVTDEVAPPQKEEKPPSTAVSLLTKSKNASTENIMEKALRILELFNDESIYARFDFERDSEVTRVVMSNGHRSVTEEKSKGSNGGAEDQNQLEHSFVPFHMQGDEDLEKPEISAERLSLMQNPKVLKALDRFWRIFRFKDVKYGLSRDQYVQLHAVISKSLRNDFSTKMEKGLAARDWARDAENSRGMQKETFRKSLFELADIWTLDVNVLSYVSFLEELFLRVCSPPDLDTVLRKLNNVNPKHLKNDRSLLNWALEKLQYDIRSLDHVATAKYSFGNKTEKKLVVDSLEASNTSSQQNQEVCKSRHSKSPQLRREETEDELIEKMVDQRSAEEKEEVLARIEEYLYEEDPVEEDLTDLEIERILKEFPAASTAHEQYMQMVKGELKLSVLYPDRGFDDDDVVENEADLVSYRAGTIWSKYENSVEYKLDYNRFKKLGRSGSLAYVTAHKKLAEMGFNETLKVARLEDAIEKVWNQDFQFTLDENSFRHFVLEPETGPSARSDPIERNTLSLARYDSMMAKSPSGS